MQAYCVKCKTPREMDQPQQTTMKNGKPSVRGTCPICGTTVNKIGAHIT
jgi:hypothetical protein